MAKLAFLGLGMMGRGMASCLLQAGHDVTVWNRSPGKAEALAASGARVAATPQQAAEGADAVFSMVADDQASTHCWLSEQGAMQALAKGTFVIECSTISHDHSKRLADAAKGAGLRYLDCPVNGPPSAAAQGKLVLLVGASKPDLDLARPWLETLSQSILHFGPVGTGTAYKLLNNLLGAVHVAAIAEAANVARRLGLDVETTEAAVKTGPIGSPHTVRMIKPMLEGRAADSFGLAIGLREKDARYCLQMARGLGLNMSVGEDAHAWYVEASQAHGSQDDSSMLQVVEGHEGRVPKASS
ncbi:MAG: NAD(P)-dependent oxidoreductase [Pseudomonadota bacterium]